MKIKKESRKVLRKRLFAYKKLTFLIIAILLVVSILSLSNSYAMQRLSRRVFYKTQNLIPALAYKDATVKLNVPVHKQEHSLSCEIATLKMALNFYGLEVEELELQEKLLFETKDPRDLAGNIWGDPNIGFVGDIDGTMPNSGYGVYEKPIADIAQSYRKAEALQNTSIQNILEQVTQGHPVIIWGTLGDPKDISWKTAEGKEIKAVFGEHTRVVIGYSGTVNEPKEIFLIDPVYGEIKMSTEKFSDNWAHLGNRAVVVY